MLFRLSLSVFRKIIIIFLTQNYAKILYFEIFKIQRSTIQFTKLTVIAKEMGTFRTLDNLFFQVRLI